MLRRALPSAGLWTGAVLFGVLAAVAADPYRGAGGAAPGVLFGNPYCSYPICCPWRANMWSERDTHHCESWNNDKGLGPGVPTCKDRLEQVGCRFASDAGGTGKHDDRSGGHSQLARITA